MRLNHIPGISYLRKKVIDCLKKIVLFSCCCCREYESGLTVVDDIVAKVENLMENYYGDKETLFLFTSDHGMTDWGKNKVARGSNKKS